MYKIIISIVFSFIFFNQGMANNDIISSPPERSWTVEDVKKVTIEKPIGLNIDRDSSELVLPIFDAKDELTGQQDSKNEDKNRLRIGDHYKLPKIPINKWRIISNVPENYSIRIAIYAANAKMIRVHFKNSIFTDQVKIFVYGEAKESFELLDRKNLNDRNGYWSPPISGEYYYIECKYSNIPIKAPVIDKISVIDKDLSSGTDKVGPCHNDISCRSDLIRNYGSAVALFIYEDSIGSHACTGALLTDLDPDTQIPWFLTANHCGIDSDVAPSTVFYFRYQTSTCNGVPPSYTTTPRILGAEHIISYAPSDFTLLRLEGGVPAGSWLLGWNPNPIAVGSQSYTIHHPDRSYKRISDGQIINYLPSGYDDTNHLTVLWTSGVTEAGSSGAPLIYDSGWVIGQLHGGPSSCYVSGNERRDYYGRFSVSWNNGLSTYLSSRYPPSVAISPSPSNGARGVNIGDVLRWVNGAGATSYDVYFGTDSTLSSSTYKGNQTSTVYDPGTLAYNTTYYWRVDARNSAGVTPGNVWRFTTRNTPNPASLPVILMLLN